MDAPRMHKSTPHNALLPEMRFHFLKACTNEANTPGKGWSSVFVYPPIAVKICLSIRAFNFRLVAFEIVPKVLHRSIYCKWIQM